MIYNSMLDKNMLTVAVGTSTRVTCKLPKDMKPNKETFESLGFIFKDINDDIFYQATLPKGWKLKPNGFYYTIIIDEKNRKRVTFFCKSSSYDNRGHMNLSKRFSTAYKHTDPENQKSPIKVFIEDADESIFFNVGQCKSEYSNEYEDLLSKATEYLDTNYPEWKNPTKYWN